MRRSMRESEDQKDIKAPAGRRTRSLLSITTDCCLRRSTRINKAMDNNTPEPSENSRITRSRASTVEPEPRTPTSTSKRDVRAGSETKTMTPGRFTRKTKASSVSISEDNLKESLASWMAYGTPRSNRRLSMLPSQPSVAEETQNLKAEKRKSMDMSVNEVEDDTGRFTRKKRASSVSISEDNLKESLASWMAYGTPRSNRRLSMLPSQPSVAEETQNLKAEKRKSMEMSVNEIEDDTGRFTRISEDNLKESLASWTAYGTPRSNRRLSMLPSQPSVAEETLNLKAEKRKSMEMSVIEIEDDTDEESSKEKVPEKIEVADSGGQVAIDSTEASSPDPKMSADINTSPGKNGCDKNKLTNTENENSLTSLAQTPRTFKPKQRSQMLLRREKEMEESATNEEYCFSESENEIEKKKIETDGDSSQLNEDSIILPQNRHSLKDSSADTLVIVIDEAKTTSQSKVLKPEEFSIVIDKTTTDRWISSEKENKKPTYPHENDSDYEIDVCELSQKEDEFSNRESLLRNQSAQDSGLVRSETEESDVEIEVCDTKPKGKENIHSLNAVVVLQDILEDMKHKVSVSSVKKNEEHLQNWTPKKRYSLVDVTKRAANNGGMKVVEARNDVEKEDSERGETREETEDVSESKDEEVPDRKDETKVSKSEEPNANDAAELKNLEDTVDVRIEKEENEKRGPSVEKERKQSFSIQTDDVASPSKCDQISESSLKNQLVENCPMETSATGNFEEIMEVDVKESEEIAIIESNIEKSPEENVFDTENEKCLSPKMSRSKVLETSTEKLEIPTKTPKSSPVKTSESLVKTPLLNKSVTERQSPLQERSEKISEEENESSPYKASCNSGDTIIYDPLLFKSPQATSDQNSPLKRSTVTISPMQLENTTNDSGIIISESPKEKNIRTPDVASKSGISSDKKISEIEILKVLTEFPAEESPVSLSLQFECDSENGTIDVASLSRINSGEIKSELKNKEEEKSPGNLNLESELKNETLAVFASTSLKNVENEDLDLEIKDKPLNPLSESPKKKSTENLNLRSESSSTSESESLFPFLCSESNEYSEDEDPDLESKGEPLNTLSESPKKKSPENWNLRSESISTSESDSVFPVLFSESGEYSEYEDLDLESKGKPLNTSEYVNTLYTYIKYALNTSESPKSPEKLNLRSESSSTSESENQLPIVSSSSSQNENEDSDIVIEDEFLESSLKSHKEVSSRKLSLQSESTSSTELENKTPDAACESRKNSENEDSDIEIEGEALNTLSESPKKKSPAKLNLRSGSSSTSDSENQPPIVSSASSKNSENKDSDIVIEDAFLESSLKSHKEVSSRKLSLQSESTSSTELENKTPDVAFESRKNSENEDSDSEIEDDNSKKQAEKEKRPKKLSKRGKEKSVSPTKPLSNGSVEKNLTEFQFGYLDDESESTDEEIEALETFEKIKALQLKEREALKLKEELAAIISKNETEILKLKEEMETSKSKEILKTVNSEESEPIKVKGGCREEIERKEKDESIVKLVDFETHISSAPENRGSSIVAGSPRKQTDEKEEELESLFKDITEEEFSSSQRIKNPFNLEGESEDDLVLLDEEDAEEDVEPLESRETTFNDSSILILDHDRQKVQKESDEELQSKTRSRGKRLSVEFMKHICHSPKNNENLTNDTLRSPLKKLSSPVASNSRIDEEKTEISPLINQSPENRRSSRSEKSSQPSYGGKKTNGPVVRKIEILKTVIPLQRLKGCERKVDTEVEGTVIEEVNENGKKERKSPLNQPMEKPKINKERLPMKSKPDSPKKSKGFLPDFLNKFTSSEEEDTDSSIDTDVAMEYNLPGHKISRVDDVIGDECRSSETEDLGSDAEDQGSLADFIVNDDANLEADETADSDPEASSDNQNVECQEYEGKTKKSMLAMKEMERKEEISKSKKKKQNKRNKEEPAINVVVEERDENSQNKKKKKKTHKSKAEIEPEIEVEKNKKKNRKLEDKEEKKVENDIQIEVESKKEKKIMKKVLPEVLEEKIELEVPEKRKKDKVLTEVPEEKIELEVPEKRTKKKKVKVLSEVPDEKIELEVPEKRKKKKKVKVLSEVPDEKIELDLPEKRKKKKKDKVLSEVPEEKIELELPEKRMKKKKNKVLSEVSEEKMELELPEKRKKKKKDKVLSEVPEEKIELELPEKRRKKKKDEVLPEVPEENIELDFTEKRKKKKKSKDEEFIAHKAKEEKKKKKDTVNEEIPQIDEEYKKKKKKDKKKKTTEEPIASEISQFDLQASNEQSDKKKNKKRRKDNTEVKVPELELQVSEPKKKHKKVTHDDLLEFRNQQRDIKEQEIKIQDQERRMKDQEIVIKGQEKIIQDREREIKYQERETVKEKKKKSKPERKAENVNKKCMKRLPEEVLESLSDLPQERKKQKLSNESKKPKSKENIEKGNESLSDQTKQKIDMASLSMIDKKLRKIPYLVEESESPEISLSGGTSEFAVAKFMSKKIALLNIRDNLRKRRCHGFTFVSQVQNQKKKHPADREKMTEDTIRLEKRNRFAKDVKKANNK